LKRGKLWVNKNLNAFTKNKLITNQKKKEKILEKMYKDRDIFGNKNYSTIKLYKNSKNMIEIYFKILI
jgi:hypothetical protein